jgi:hypothetical protein
MSDTLRTADEIPFETQQRMLRLMYGTFREIGAWPTFQYLSSLAWEELEREPRDVYYALGEAGFVRPAVSRTRPFDLRDDTSVGASLLGLMYLEEAGDDLLRFVGIVRYIGNRAIRWRPSSPTAAERLEITSDDVAAELGIDRRDRSLDRQAGLLRGVRLF